MLAGKRVHKEIILAMVMAVLLLAATSRTARAEGTCTTGTCYDEQYINYFSNAAAGNGKVYARITDPVEASATQPDEICSMIYVFDPFQGMQECCGCPITPDGLLTLSIGLGAVPSLNGNLTSNPFSVTGQFFFNSGAGGLIDGVIRLVSTTTNGSTTPDAGFNRLASGTAEFFSGGTFCDRYSGKCCDPTGGATRTGRGSLTLVDTLRAWVDHIQGFDPNTGSNAVTNTEFEEVPIIPSDANELANACFRTISTGNGICNCGNEFVSEAPNEGGAGTGGL